MHYTRRPIPMKRIRIVLIVAAVLLVALVCIEIVPKGVEELRVEKDGSVSVLKSGWHFVTPGGDYLEYPAGDRSFRVPADGSFSILFQNGDSLRVAYEFDLSFAPGSSALLYQYFSTGFETAFSKLVTSTAEIEAASRPTAADKGDLDAAVVASVRGELQPLGVDVRRGGQAQGGSAAARSKAPRRLVIVGVDGGDWLNLRPLIDAGKLPNFARLVREGATGPLRSEEPMLSPRQVRSRG